MFFIKAKTSQNLLLTFSLVLSFTYEKKSFGQACKNAITYADKSGGWFGDTLIMFSKAKWLSYKYGLTFLYKPFDYSSELMVHETARKFQEFNKKTFKKVIAIKNESEINSKTDEPTLYVINFYTQVEHFHQIMGITAPGYGPPELKDLGTIFIRDLKNDLTPKKVPPALERPQKTITVAAHIRKPLKTDFIHKPSPIVKWPGKFCSDEFFIDQIRKIADMFPEQQVYVYLFTNDPEAEKLKESYRNAVHRKNIAIQGSENIDFSRRVVDDLYLMSTFDCLIRTSSGFARMAQSIGNHKIVIYPAHGSWVNNKYILDVVGIKQNDEYQQNPAHYVIVEK